MVKRYLFLVTCLIHSFIFFAQQNLSFRFVENEKLRSKDILKLYVGKSGVAWILTTNGFMSFDGSEIKYFKDTLPGNFSNPFVSFLPEICEDNDGKLYAWKYETGIVCFDPQRGTYSVCEAKGKDSLLFRKTIVRELLLDQNNIFWIASNSGLIKYSCKNPHPQFFEFSEKNLEYLYKEVGDSAEAKKRFITSKNFFYTISKDYSDPEKLWITNGQCLFEFDKSKEIFNTVFTSDPKIPQKYGYVISKLIDCDEDKIVFSSMGGGVGVYSKSEHDFHFCLIDSSIYQQMGIRTNKNIGTAIFRGPGKGFYVSYNDAVPHYFDPFTGKQDLISTDPLLKGCRIYVDNNNRVWAFTKNRLYYSIKKQLNPGEIDVSFQSKKENAKNVLASVFWDAKEGKYYAGINFSDGVFVWDSSFSKSLVYTAANPDELNLLESVIWDIINLSGTSWAIGLGNRLLVLDKSSNRYLHYTQIPFFKNKFNLGLSGSEREVLDLLKVSDDEFYFLTGKEDIFRFDMKSMSCNKIISCSDKPKKIFWGLGKLLEGRKGELFATDYHTIFKLNLFSKAVSSFEPIATPHDVGVNLVDVVVDQNHNIWVAGSNNEVSCYSGDNFKLVRKLPIDVKLSSQSNLVVTPENVLIIGEGSSLVLYDINRDKIFRYNYRNGLKITPFAKVLYANGYVFLGYDNIVQYIPMTQLLQFQKSPSPYLAGVNIYDNDFIPDSILKRYQTIYLRHNENFLSLRFSALEYDFTDQISYEYRMPELDTTWVTTDYFNRGVSYLNLKPGNYTFQLRSSLPNSDYKALSVYKLSISPAWWQTNLFKLFSILFVIIITAAIISWRIRSIRKVERQKSAHEKELLELEAKALRAQMNPHFIFNSLNSIKALINKSENDKAAKYLTTFSKLIRTLFQNSDKREVSLFEELETCKLYAELEKMRFGEKIEFTFDIDESLDLKGVKIPALILQPFIENAIWHGLIPKTDGGKVLVSVRSKDETIECIIDDDGIGRELSKQYKAQYRATHESKGIGLTQSRLELDKILNEREDTIRIIDKKDEKGLSAGTRVLITFKEHR